MDCVRYQQLIQLYVDRELDSEDVQYLKEHITGCPSCKNELKQMIALVSSIEGMKPKRKRKKYIHIPSFTAACVIAFVLIYMLPVFPSSGISELKSTPLSSTVVLADESESLPIPEKERIHLLTVEDYGTMDQKPHTTWIYPSAIASVLKNADILDSTKRYIFVSVPDAETWQLIAESFQPFDVKVNHPMTFPASFILDFRESSSVDVFTFPKKQEGFTEWFSKMSGI